MTIEVNPWPAAHRRPNLPPILPPSKSMRTLLVTIISAKNKRAGRRRILAASILAVGLWAAFLTPKGHGLAAATKMQMGFGAPLPGLTGLELAAFEAGKQAFEEVEGAADGLGPVFNGASCAECHNGQATGGGNATLSTVIGRRVRGRFDPLVHLGGPTIQKNGIVGLEGYQFQGEAVPDEATIVSKRRSPPIFGLGLVDAVPDEM